MKRKPILLDKVWDGKCKHYREVIGLIGTHHGVGVTYTGLMLAFYMGEELGKKTAFLECNNHHDMSLIQSAYIWSEKEDFSFDFQQITCYKDVSTNFITEIFNDDYDCLILDFGTDFTENRDKFMRCDTKVVIGGRAEWDQQKLVHFVNAIHTTNGNKAWLHFIPCADSKTITKLKYELERNIYAIPFEADPTILSKNAIRLFDELFCI